MPDEQPILTPQEIGERTRSYRILVLGLVVFIVAIAAFVVMQFTDISLILNKPQLNPSSSPEAVTANTVPDLDPYVPYSPADNSFLMLLPKTWAPVSEGKVSGKYFFAPKLLDPTDYVDVPGKGKIMLLPIEIDSTPLDPTLLNLNAAETAVTKIDGADAKIMHGTIASGELAGRPIKTVQVEKNGRIANFILYNILYASYFNRMSSSFSFR
ncbi:MAG TPA: hypothetical protein VFG51_01985 [Candidatus Saccharimonadia bacterium]|nr:hypothetical protein [Candidatus Saccharimonadia bacterium]